ncbi:MAG TPA: preprotein translocase subunit SecE [Gemmatales bacterium]|nr:preprotein translocase subunit SecE [Gemmatales bacterium]
MALAVADEKLPGSASAARKMDAASLGWNGIVGTAYVILAYLAVAHLVPWLYSTYITTPGLLAGFGLLVSIAAAMVAVVYLWNMLFPAKPGLRAAVATGVGKVILGFLVIFLLGYIVDGIFGAWFERLGIRFYLGMAFMGVLAAWWINQFILKDFFSSTFPKRMLKLEEGGWFSAETYKKVQGQKIRRIVMLVIILAVGLAVYYYIWLRGVSVGSAPYVWDIPFVSSLSLILFRSPSITIPVLLLGLAVWFGWRLVNYPPMAEYLILTEAEMTKVTWTSRQRLIRDTGVVLLCILFFAAFLYLLDIIWVLVLSTIGVLQR